MNKFEKKLLKVLGEIEESLAAIADHLSDISTDTHDSVREMGEK